MVTADGQTETRIPLQLKVTADSIRNAGDDDPQRLSRLRWLDSRLATDDGIAPPYTAIERRGNALSILGRKVVLGRNGFPASIESFFDVEMTKLTDQPSEMLQAPVELVAENSAGKAMRWKTARLSFSKLTPGAAEWTAESRAGELAMKLNAHMDFDGDLEFSAAIKAWRDTAVRDIRLEIPLERKAAQYLMGLGFKGGAAPAAYDWKWDVHHNQDGAWVGSVNAGLQFSLRDNHYSRPLNTNFYQSKPLVMPQSWDNGGRGGCHLRQSTSGDNYLVSCYSGARQFSAGETQYFNFRLLLTPFHPIDPGAHWRDRYFHAHKPIQEIAATGANVINIHHATAINPYINYPFLRPQEMKEYIADAHRHGMRVKIYYTVRELTNHAPELFALRSLGDEVLADGPGGGVAWLQEHVGSNYIAGWHVPALKDSALITAGASRWLNFYVEGLRWLVENEAIDGLYLDDIAFDRVTMKRVRKVLLRGNPQATIDVHSANQFNPRDGFASSANLYLEHFPFIDRLWFGEYFDYNSPPDYWLVEMSGIPFGLMGEMLQDGGNPWRGMLYGMTNRLPWAGDPRPIWHFWDRYEIEKSRMIGYWVPSTPIKTGRGDVLATTYKENGRALVALASWAKESASVRLQIDWKALGLDSSSALIHAPAIENFQEEKAFKPEETIPVAPGKGWLLVIDSPLRR